MPWRASPRHSTLLTVQSATHLHQPLVWISFLVSNILSFLSDCTENLHSRYHLSSPVEPIHTSPDWCVHSDTAHPCAVHSAWKPASEHVKLEPSPLTFTFRRPHSQGPTLEAGQLRRDFYLHPSIVNPGHVYRKLRRNSVRPCLLAYRTLRCDGDYGW
jgi:hypothetical protein